MPITFTRRRRRQRRQRRLGAIPPHQRCRRAWGTSRRIRIRRNTQEHRLILVRARVEVPSFSFHRRNTNAKATTTAANFPLPPFRKCAHIRRHLDRRTIVGERGMRDRDFRHHRGRGEMNMRALEWRYAGGGCEWKGAVGIVVGKRWGSEDRTGCHGSHTHTRNKTRRELREVRGRRTGGGRRFEVGYNEKSGRGRSF